MKKLVFVYMTVLSLGMCHTASAQEDRNKLEMTLTSKGLTDRSKVFNVNYYFSRPTPASKRDTVTKNSPFTIDEEYFYISISLDTISTQLLQMIADPDTKVNGTITIKDNYTGKQLKEIKFYDALLNNFSESLSNYSYGGSGGGTSLSIMTPRFYINGVELKK
ncbi:MAG TPA: type VI secretion system tube protein TssD [Flavipsychrobacter sp.]|nr:type VI secretion system tube protein TssD [Flavipsychrobacter sp.]